MLDKDLQALLQKAEELRALFVLGQRVIPFLEEIFIFVGEIKPLLDEINHSIEENIRKMPKASHQISKVTEATENATTEIMDTLDGMTYKTNIMSSNLQKIRQMAVGGPLPGSDLNVILDNCDSVLNSVQDDSNTIMMALQVQDITSQQLAAVNNLLQTIQGKLARILNHFRSSEMNDLISGAKLRDNDHQGGTNISVLHRTIAFDPEAVDAFSTDKNRQQIVDDLVNNRENLDFDATPEDINTLFAGSASSEETFIPTQSNPPQAEVEEFSQDDIDALFGATIAPAKVSNSPIVDDMEEFSQDDIDALFRS